jgi:hypothetical protein
MIAALPHAAALASDIAISSRSRFSDSIWHLDGLRPGGNRSDFSLDWDFTIAAGRFNDPGFAPWCEAAKTFLWSVKVDPPPGRRHLHDGTLASLFKALRLLIRWMADQGYRRFAELDRDASERFLSAMAARRNAKGEPIAPSTIKLYRRLLKAATASRGRSLRRVHHSERECRAEDAAGEPWLTRLSGRPSGPCPISMIGALALHRRRRGPRPWPSA